MLYYLFDWLDKAFDFPGAGVFQYISFRTAMAVITSLIITVIFGKPLIKYLKKKQIGETVRDLGLEGQKQKEGTPTMGGIIIFISVMVSSILFARLNLLVFVALFVYASLTALGFADDYTKIVKKNSKGVSGKVK